jgi:hypothetical protein
MTRVAAVAGRRIDAADAQRPSFPESSEGNVKSAVMRVIRERAIELVVASAACGADIVAIEAARELGLRFRIVLPFDAGRFRDTSVVDRGPSWGVRYDALLAAAEARGDVVVVADSAADDDAAYALATRRILDEARALAGGQPIALALWDERPRSTTDATREFVELARAGGLEVVTIPTLAD